MNTKYLSGQAALFLVVAIIVGLSAVLSVATRSLTNVRTSTEERQSQEAFNAAESGIDEFYKNKEDIEKEIGSSLVNVTSEEIKGTEVSLNDGNPVLQDDGADVWLADKLESYPTFSNPRTRTLSIQWNVQGDCGKSPTPALEVLYFSGSDIQNIKTDRKLVDPCTVRKNTNRFSDGPVATSGGKYIYSLTINNGILVRITPIYTSAVIKVISNSDLPVQGEVISATGETGDLTRKIKIYQAYSKVPSEILQYSLLVP